MNIRSFIRMWVVCASLAVSSVQAEVLVLVHGWSADAGTWLHSGVMGVLESHGWVNAGVIVPAPGGAVHLPAPVPPTQRMVYLAQLTAEAPLLLQSVQLLEELRIVRGRHPEDVITLVGHSAGGLVARLTLVRSDAPAVDRLITIGSPHLGTTRAIDGLDIVNSKPFFCPGPGVDFLKTVVGGDDYDYLKYSYPALVDMQPAGPGSLIDWLNHQPHPAIEYHAVIHSPPGYAGDEIVPAFSQDLNQVPSLRGRATVHIAPAGHALNPGDGVLVAAILDAEQNAGR